MINILCLLQKHWQTISYALITQCFLYFWKAEASLKIKPVGSFIHLFCYLFHDCIEQLLKVGADMNTTDDNNR